VMYYGPDKTRPSPLSDAELAIQAGGGGRQLTAKPCRGNNAATRP